MNITEAREIATSTLNGFRGHKDDALKAAAAKLTASAKRGNQMDDALLMSLETWAADRAIEL